MTELRAEGHMTATGKARLTTGLGAEGWQWLAFLFAAAVTVLSALMDDLVARQWRLAVGRVALFGGLFYLFMLNRRFREWLRGWLETVRVDSR